MKNSQFIYLLNKLNCLNKLLESIQSDMGALSINNIVTYDEEYQILDDDNYITFIGTSDAYLPQINGNTGMKLNLMNGGSEIVMVHSNSGDNDIYYSGMMVNFVSIDPGTKLEIYNNSLNYFTT